MTRVGALQRDRRGAALVFGIFFAVFLVACVFKLHGLTQVILYRQAVQDAADASAFAAAVVNARGMNLIALINMTMAAVLSVLVGLRLAQTLCVIGLSLCVALAYPTMGNSLAYVPSLTTATRNLKKVTKKVKKVVPKILASLHTAGKAVSVVIPLGANARVLEVAIQQHNQKLGVALPGRFTLPVQDGQFIDLCRHAGQLAGEVAMLPISPFVGGKVEEGIAHAAGAIAQAAPDWFCGKQAKGKKPDLDPGGAFDPIDLPVLPRQKACNDTVGKYQAVDELSDEQQAEVDQTCGAAAVEYLASSPGQDGRSRDGERLCPVDCKTRPRSACPPNDVELCDQAQAIEVDGQAARSGQSSIVPGGSASPYGQRLGLAHAQCDPASPHGYALGGFAWVEQLVTYQYVWDPARRAFVRDPAVQVLHPKTELVRLKDEDRSQPCGPHGVVGDPYGTDPTNVCEDDGRCSDSSGTALSSGPCASPFNTKSYWQTHRRVVGILRCVELRPHQEVETPDIDLDQELQSSKKKGQNTSPFELDKDAWLGGSDFQLRAIVVGNDPGISAGQLVELASWGEDAEPLDQALKEIPEQVGRLGLSQGEYYFDVGEFGEYADQQKQADRVEWLWNQGWVARLRPFRLSYKKADAPRAKKPAYDPEQAAFRDPNKPAMPEPGLGDFAGKVGSDQLEKLLDQGGGP
ncbi:MAG: hypothetical protein QM778_36465 [Myxococcales bacterium]